MVRISTYPAPPRLSNGILDGRPSPGQIYSTVLHSVSFFSARSPEAGHLVPATARTSAAQSPRHYHQTSDYFTKAPDILLLLITNPEGTGSNQSQGRLGQGISLESKPH